MQPIPPALLESLADRYAVERELGQGGMATVYLARDLKHDRQVALKVLRPELAAILGRDRFLAEIRLTAKLDHPHILTLLDSGESDGLLWYTLPYIRGESLRHKLDRELQLGVAEALSITRQVAGALDYAHQQGIIHRDVKPENILLHEGEAMLADFGIALAVREAGGRRLTETGLSLGTPQYMSPEQATAERALDARSDIYSLGAVLYEMLAGEPPHSGPSAQAIIAKLLTEPPTRLRVVRDTVSAGVEAAVAQALAKVPADRFPSAAAFAEALAAPAAFEAPRRLSKWALPLGGAAVLVVAALWLAPRLRPGSPPTLRAEPKLTQITFTGNATNPVVSPDGKRVAYAERTCRSFPDCTYGVVVQDLALGERITLAEGYKSIYRLAWSADQRFVVLKGYSAADVATDVLISALGGRQQDIGCCFSMFFGGTDTIVQAWSITTSRRGEETTWFTVGTREGVKVDSIPLTLRVEAGENIYPLASPASRRLLVWRIRTDTSETFYLLQRDGRVTDSLVFESGRELRLSPGATPIGGYNDPSGRLYGERLAWSASGDAVLLLERTDSSLQGTWALLRYPISEAGRFRRPPDSLATQLHLPGVLRPDQAMANLTTPSLTGDVALHLGEPNYALWTLERTSPTEAPRLGRKLGRWTGKLDALISPDGSQVLIARRVTNANRQAWQLEVLPYRGGEGRLLGAPLDTVVRVGWSQDSREVYRLIPSRVPGQFDLDAVEVASGRARLVRSVADSLVPLPSGWGLPGGLLFANPRWYREAAGPFEWRAPSLGDSGAIVFRFQDSSINVIAQGLYPDGRGSWMAAAVRRMREVRREGELMEFGLWVAGVHTPGNHVASFLGTPPVLVYGAPNQRFLVVVQPTGTTNPRWFQLEPGRPPRDLGPPSTLNWPHTFSDDGLRSVVVELEDESDVWLLQWPGQDSTGAGGRQ